MQHALYLQALMEVVRGDHFGEDVGVAAGSVSVGFRRRGSVETGSVAHGSVQLRSVALGAFIVSAIRGRNRARELRGTKQILGHGMAAEERKLLFFRIAKCLYA